MKTKTAVSRTKRKIAVSRLTNYDGTPFSRSTPWVVELSGGIVSRYHPLTEEEPQTEWLGGNCRLLLDDEGQLVAFLNGKKL
jgi:hypothetical protein